MSDYGGAFKSKLWTYKSIHFNFSFDSKRLFQMLGNIITNKYFYCRNNLLGMFSSFLLLDESYRLRFQRGI